MLSLEEFKTKLKNEGTVDWSNQPSLEFLWRYEMHATRDEIWAYLSDTSRFNREMGFGKRHQVEKEGKVFVTTKMIGFTQRWIEEPWTWLVGHTITSTRIYLEGMAQKVHSVFHIDDDKKTNRRIVHLYFGWNPKNAFWSFFLKATAPILQKNFGKAFTKLDNHYANLNLKSTKAFRTIPPPLSPEASKKVREVKSLLLSRNLNAKAIEHIADLVLTGDDLDLEPIKILPLSHEWKIDEQQVLRASLHATRLGLLKMSWDVICPHCRGSRYTAESLGDIPELASCKVCDIEFSTSDATSIEVMFHVHPSIRKVEQLMFCAAEPAKKNHIKIQQLVQPNAELSIPVRLDPGSYRARLTGLKSEVIIEVKDSHSQTELHLSEMNGENFKVGTHFQMNFKNTQKEAYLFVFENLWWESSALKPAHILAMPEFRDLFSEEHLSSNVKLFLGDQTLLFTDIVGSTKFYNHVGDAKAFAEVRLHFQDLFAVVQSHKGVVVKTIGDAVMAAFQSPNEAIQASIDIQKIFHEDRSDSPIRLRVSVHCGPVIAVHLNTGIDYFGNTVNYAAKIQAVARACEVALSQETYEIYKKEFKQDFDFDVRQNQRDGGVPGDIYVLHVKRASQKAA